MYGKKCVGLRPQQIGCINGGKHEKSNYKVGYVEGDENLENPIKRVCLKSSSLSLEVRIGRKHMLSFLKPNL